MVGALAAHDRGAVRITGPDGSGKSSALAYLADILPPHLRVTLLDGPDPLTLAEASSRGLVVFASGDPGTRPLGEEPDQFVAPHGIAVDSRGDIYVGEVSYTNWGRRVRAKGEQIPPGLRSLQKLVKVG